MAQASAKALHTSLGKLQISKDPKSAPRTRAEPADSWEDEASEDSSDTETGDTPPASAINLSSSYDSPAPPPPTPSSPSFASSYAASTLFRTFPPDGLDGASDSKHSSGSNTPSKRIGVDDDKRPEKTTAVASRLIAVGIGQKVPKRTKEQREYEQAMKVQEKKKRDAVKAEEQQKKEQKEQAFRDVWGD